MRMCVYTHIHQRTVAMPHPIFDYLKRSLCVLQIYLQYCLSLFLISF